MITQLTISCIVCSSKHETKNATKLVTARTLTLYYYTITNITWHTP